jgi:Abortive infection alpha
MPSEIPALTGSGAALILLMKLLSKPAREVGELLTDYVRGWRLANLERIAQKLATKLRERQLPPEIKPLPTGIGLVLVDAASREEDDDLQSLWANLLANHTDPNAGVDLDKDILDVLHQMTSIDARLLTYLQTQTHSVDIHTVLAGGFDTPRLAEDLRVEPARIARSVNNLWRLGCLVQEQAGPQRLDGVGLRVVGPTAVNNVSYGLSPLGEALLRAVRP